MAYRFPSNGYSSLSGLALPSPSTRHKARHTDMLEWIWEHHASPMACCMWPCHGWDPASHSHSMHLMDEQGMLCSVRPSAEDIILYASPDDANFIPTQLPYFPWLPERSATYYCTRRVDSRREYFPNSGHQHTITVISYDTTRVVSLVSLYGEPPPASRGGIRCAPKWHPSDTSQSGGSE